MAKSKLPAIQFYVGDWKKDVGLQSCSIGARGLWFEMLLMMHESPIRGYLMLTDQIPMHDEHIARVAGVDQSLVSHLIEELEQNGVFDYERLQITPDRMINVIKSRRMVADEQKRQKCSVAGLRGVKNNPIAQGTYIGDTIRGDGSSSSSSSLSSTTISIAYTEEEIQLYKSMPGVSDIWSSVPKSRQNKPKTTQLQIGATLHSIRDRENPTEFLKRRISAYYASAEGRGEYHRSLIRWLSDEGYDEPDEAWESRKETRRQL
jgi:hypothetical protein